MGFAAQYLAKNRLFGGFISTPPGRDLKYIVVIPSYNEERLINTLNALWRVQNPRYSVEVIVVVNSSAQSPGYIREKNRQTLREIDVWSRTCCDNTFAVYALHTPGLPEKDFGAGLARKIGMDEAINRFEQLNRGDGYIISLDADTTVKDNYFTEIEQSIEKRPAINAGILYFEHPLEGVEFSGEIYDAVAKYELFLRYYNQALRWAGFPYAFHTIGSAFFVRALAYVKQGGMIRRKAGEDFYFLNKIFQLGNICEVNSTAVYPSPRFSGRVLFGTGPEVEKITREPDKPYMTYNPEAFRTLKAFFDGIERLFHSNDTDVEDYLNALDPGLKAFLRSIGLKKEIKRINNNCKRPEVFRKHFFQWFGGLKIIRYMHVVHEHFLDKVPVHLAASEMLEMLGYSRQFANSSANSRVFQLLSKYREIERGREHRV
ncbi:MAG: glycosyltransferase family A protein [Bacteroidota bacterium]